MIDSLTHIDYKVKIGDNTRIEGSVGMRIGKNSVVAMAAVVIKDVPPDIVVMGHPARIKYSRTEYDRKKAEWDLHA